MDPNGLGDDGKDYSFKSTSELDIDLIKRLKLELKVKILNTKAIKVDRHHKSVTLEKDVVLPYDVLVVACGLQDETIHRVKPAGLVNGVNGALSIGDPGLPTSLEANGTFIKALIWNPLCYAVVYGKSLDVYGIICGLLKRNVPHGKIIVIRPSAYTSNNNWDSVPEIAEIKLT